MTFRQDLLLYLAGARILLYKLLWARRKPAPVEWRDARVLCLGLDGAGKSSLLRRAADASADLDSLKPTTGFNVRTLTVLPDWKLEVWDIGGDHRTRACDGRGGRR